MTTTSSVGPVDFAVFVLPETSDPAAGFAALLQLVDDGRIDLLDLEVVDAAGTHLELSADLLGGLAPFVGADSGLLDADDLAQVAAELHDGEVAVVVVYQDLALDRVAEAFVSGGAELHSVGGIDIASLDARLQGKE